MGISPEISNPENLEHKQEGKAEHRRSWFTRRVVLVVIPVTVLAVIAALFFSFKADAPPLVPEPKAAAIEAKEPMSRQVMFLAEQIVKDVKPPPTTAALQYAYVASAYYDALKVGGQVDAWRASHYVLKMLYPDQTTRITDEMTKIAVANNLSLTDTNSESPDIARQVIDTYSARYKSDKHELVWDGKIPTGPGKWLQLSAIGPFTPRAGEWQRWIVNKSILVPPPPAVGSVQDLKELEMVKQASASRNGEDVNKINFWGGAPGTESPGGVWQNQVYATIKDELPAGTLPADLQYAEIQRDVAQTISDAFMECWKVKFTYWTARPSMRIPALVTAMPNPNFPGYISGHSTISKAAADVLSTLIPKHAAEWQSMAVEARDSRLKAGIHYDIDNKVGFDVGTEVAKQAITNLKLQAFIK